MNIASQRRVFWFLLGAAALMVGGAAAFGYVSGLLHTEHLILFIALGTPVMVCASGVYLLLRAVRQSGLRPLIASIYFALLVVSCPFIPLVFLVIFQALWPHALRSDSTAFLLSVAPIYAASFLIAMFFVFAIGLFFCRHRHGKSSV